MRISIKVKNKWTILLVIIGLTAFFNCNSQSVRGPVVAQFVDPPNGLWIIEETLIYKNCDLILNGSVLIKPTGNLTLHNVTIRINCAFNGQYNITVESEYWSGGVLVIKNSTITAFNPIYAWFLVAEARSVIDFEDSTFSHAGWRSVVPGSFPPRQREEHSGLWIDTNEGARIVNCTISDNCYGLCFDSARNCLITNNTIINSVGIGLDLGFLSDHCIISNNHILHSGEEGIYGSLFSDNITISHNTIDDTGDGGIYLSFCDHSNVSFNTVTNSGSSGIFLMSVDNSTIEGNLVSNSHYIGINLGFSQNTTISNNIISDQRRGIWLIYSIKNTVVGNNISGSRYYGIYMDKNGGNNTLWDNYVSSIGFANAYDENGTNQWDNGTHGNWWDDYTGIDSDGDGIGDTPYLISGGAGAKDRYPLMDYPPEIDHIPPTINQQPDHSYEEGSNDSIYQSITWWPSDENPNNYFIYQNRSLIQSGNWENYTTIDIDISGLPVGVYNYTIVVFDKSDNFVVDTVIVTITKQQTEQHSLPPIVVPGTGKSSGFTVILFLITIISFAMVQKLRKRR